jgi:hypothetical protein
MFERLVLQENFPKVRLKEQRRMHPEIARLIKGPSQYPDLTDHPYTKVRGENTGLTTSGCICMYNNMSSSSLSSFSPSALTLGLLTLPDIIYQGLPPVLGMAKRLFFWDVGLAESKEGSKSKQNVGEAKCCVALLRYLLQQGIKPSESLLPGPSVVHHLCAR